MLPLYFYRGRADWPAKRADGPRADYYCLVGARSGPSAMMSRNAPDTFGQHVGRCSLADIAETEHADHALILVDDRQPADLELFHVLHRLGKFVVLSATMDSRSHHVTRRRAACIKFFFKQKTAYEIAVGDHADKVVFLADRNRADVVLTHQFRELRDRGLRTNPLYAFVHRHLDFHHGPPLAPCWCGGTATTHMLKLFLAGLLQSSFFLTKICFFG